MAGSGGEEAGTREQRAHGHYPARIESIDQPSRRDRGHAQAQLSGGCQSGRLRAAPAKLLDERRKKDPESGDGGAKHENLSEGQRNQYGPSPLFVRHRQDPRRQRVGLRGRRTGRIASAPRSPLRAAILAPAVPDSKTAAKATVRERSAGASYASS